MKRFMSLVLALAMLIGCVSVLSSCGADDDGAQFNVYLGDEVYDFDPGDYYADSNAEQVMSLLYEPLFKLNSRGKLKMAAAEGYSVDEETRTITIDIRETYWSTGPRVQAQDFRFAWARILDPDNSNPAAALFYDIEGAVELKNNEDSDGIYGESLGIKAESPYQLKIIYKEGADYEQLLKNLASVAASPINRSAYEKDPARWSKTLASMAFNGPFVVNEVDYAENSFSLARNLGYHQNPEEADPMKHVTPSVLFSSLDRELTYDQIENKTVFYMGDATLAQRAEYKDEAEVTDELSTYSYIFNTKTNDFLKEKNVRRALSLAINRAEIVTAITFGKPATGLIPDACKDFRENDILSADANLTEAKALLAQVNLDALDTEITLVVNDDEQSIKIAELVKASWESLDSRIEVTVKEIGAVISKVKDGERELDCYDSGIQYILKEAAEGNFSYSGADYGTFDVDVIGIDFMMYSYDPFVALAGLTSNYGTSGYKIGSDGSVTKRNNVTGWTSSAYDALIDAAYKAEDEDTRLAKLREAEQLLLEESPIVPVVYNQNFAFIGNKLKNVETDGLGHFVLTEAKLKNYQDYLPKEDEE